MTCYTAPSSGHQALNLKLFAVLLSLPKIILGLLIHPTF